MELLVLDTKKIKKLIWGKQIAVAQQLGISRGSLSRKINGSQTFGINDINRFATILGVNTIDLMRERMR